MILRHDKARSFLKRYRTRRQYKKYGFAKCKRAGLVVSPNRVLTCQKNSWQFSSKEKLIVDLAQFRFHGRLSRSAFSTFFRSRLNGLGITAAFESTRHFQGQPTKLVWSSLVKGNRSKPVLSVLH